MTADRGLIWIQGKPGSGKSVTMKHLYTDYRSRCPKDEIVVGYFFTKLGEPFEKSLEGLLRVLLARILRMSPTSFRSIRDYYRSMRDYIPEFAIDNAYPVEWTESDLRNALKLVLETKTSNTKVALFIDAIDECDTLEEKNSIEIIKILNNLCAPCFTVAVKACFSSRTNPNLKGPSLGEIPGFTLEEQNADDITAYLTSRLLEAAITVPTSQDWSHLWKAFHEKADGCWLWVEYAVKALNKKGSTLADLLRELEDIPKMLYPLFDTFLEAINPNDVEEANKMLAITLAGQGIIDLEDFRFAMALGSQKTFKSQRELERQPDFVQDNFTMWAKVQERCGNFLEVKMHGLATDDISRGVVEFYHSSVIDYLSQRAGSKNSKILPYLELLKQGNASLARACMRYLAFSDVIKLIQELEMTGSSCLTPLEVMKRMPFLLYCTYFGLHHSCCALQEGKDIANEIEIFWTPPQFDSWLILRKWLARLKEPLGEDTTLTAFTIMEGAHAFVKLQIEKGHVDANETLTTFGHYLTLAAFGGELKTVEMLLDLKNPPVDIDAKGGVFCNALQAAASEGHVDVVRVLLDRGADPQITGGRFMSPLCAAAFSLSFEVVELLYTHPRCNSTVFLDQWHSTKALQFATEAVRTNYSNSDSSKDPSMVIRLLADNDFEYSLFEYVDIPIALWLLSVGSTEVMQMLIRDTASIDASGPKGFTLFHIACADGTREIVKMLVDKLVNEHLPLDRTDRSECTPLHFATMNSSHEVLEYLLIQTHQSLDINAQDARGVTPLHIAFALGSKEHIDLLLQAGANTEILGPDRMTVLHFAMLNLRGSGHLTALEELRQVDVNAIDTWERSPLHVASQYGAAENVQWLLDHDADVDLVDDEGRTALHAACQNFTIHSTAIIDILIDKGLSLSTEDFGKRTPLHLAFYDPKQVARDLCWVAFRVAFRMTDLDQFSQSNCYTTVSHILKVEGVNLLSKDNTGNTPLHLACWREQTQIILEMLNLGADPNTTDSIGSEPLTLVSNDLLRDSLEEAFLFYSARMDRKSVK